MSLRILTVMSVKGRRVWISKPTITIYFNSDTSCYSMCTLTESLFGMFHTNSSTNYSQDHMWSPLLMIYAVTAITKSIFNISPILNIQLHSWESYECNFPLFNSNIWYSYSLQEYVVFLIFCTNLNFSFIDKRDIFSSQLVLEIYVRKPRKYWEST